MNFNSTFSSVVVPIMLIKYLLHASHGSLGHAGATELCHFLRGGSIACGACVRQYTDMSEPVGDVRS